MEVFLLFVLLVMFIFGFYVVEVRTWCTSLINCGNMLKNICLTPQDAGGRFWNGVCPCFVVTREYY